MISLGADPAAFTEEQLTAADDVLHDEVRAFVIERVQPLERLLLASDREALYQAVGIEGLVSQQALALGGNHRKQRQRRDSECMDRPGLLDQQVDAQAFDTGHGGDRFALAAALEYEHRIDEVIRADPGLAHQAAREVVTAHAAHAGVGIAGEGLCIFAHVSKPVTSLCRQCYHRRQSSPRSARRTAGRWRRLTSTGSSMPSRISIV